MKIGNKIKWLTRTWSSHTHYQEAKEMNTLIMPACWCSQLAFFTHTNFRDQLMKWYHPYSG